MPSTTNGPSTIAVRDSSGNLFATVFSGSSAIFSSLTGYVYSNNVGGLSASLTIPNTALIGSGSIGFIPGLGIGVSASSVQLGGTITLSNTGVISLASGSTSYLTLTGSTGNVTINLNASTGNVQNSLVARDGNGNIYVTDVNATGAVNGASANFGNGALTAGAVSAQSYSGPYLNVTTGNFSNLTVSNLDVTTNAILPAAGIIGTVASATLATNANNLQVDGSSYQGATTTLTISKVVARDVNGNIYIAGLNATSGNFGSGALSAGSASITGAISAGALTAASGTFTDLTVTGTAVIPATGIFGTVANSTNAINLQVDGGLYYPASTAAVANTIAARDATGNLSAVIFQGTATSAYYADLAEVYLADAEYSPGTVLEFGGVNEVTLAEAATTRVAGVVSTNPAHLMNAQLTGEYTVALALTGRVPCKVTGIVRKGDMMVSAGNGFARFEPNPSLGSVIGKAVQNFAGGEGVIEVVVGRL